MEEADVVVLNTCCIRENADQRLYGTLGSLKELVDASPGPQIAVGGCLAQKDRELIQEKVGWVDVVFGTHNLASAPELLRRSRTEGPVMEILDAPAPESATNPLLGPGAIRELPYVAWVNIQTGCDNSCAFCIVPSVRGPEASRSLDDIVAEVALLAQRGVERGHVARPERKLLRKGSDQAASALRAAACGRGRSRGDRSGPLHQPPSEGSPTRDHRGDGDTPAVCEQLHLPLQSGSDAVLRAMRRGYTAAALPRAAGRGPCRHRRPGRDHRHHRGLPRRDRRRLRAHARGLSPRPSTTAPSPSSSRPARAPGPPKWSPPFVPADVIAERFDRLKTVIDRSALARHQARVGRCEEVLVEGVSRRDDAMLAGRTRQGKLIHFAAVGAAPAPGSLARVTVTGGHPHHLSGRLEEVTARPRYRVRIPVASA